LVCFLFWFCWSCLCLVVFVLFNIIYVNIV
jgi:hypothetical protein